MSFFLVYFYFLFSALGGSTYSFTGAATRRNAFACLRAFGMDEWLGDWVGDTWAVVVGVDGGCGEGGGNYSRQQAFSFLFILFLLFLFSPRRFIDAVWCVCAPPKGWRPSLVAVKGWGWGLRRRVWYMRDGYGEE